ncbi:MAG: VWA domain-containing protein [Anaerolineae bacterium]|nr:VWA domain-containing protein [Thermoflexales bacterium]MDW8394699.1 VWA domain-containing protein [Anaerolineae bacterium]
MFEFQWPAALLLTLLAPLALLVHVLVQRRRKRAAVRFSSLSLLSAALPKQSRWRRFVPLALFVLALLSAAVAVARPTAVAVAAVDRTTVILTMDVSLSMCATDVQPNRLFAAQEAALRFIDRQRPEVKLGVVAFAGYAEIVQTPTTDHDAARRAIQNLTVGRRTAIGSAILRSIDAIAAVDDTVPPIPRGVAEAQPSARPAGAYAPSVIVLLTDGVSNTGPRPEVAAQFATERGIRIYTIGFGTAQPLSELFCPSEQTGGRPLYVSRDQWGPGGIGGGQSAFRRGIDEDALRQVAEMTGGEYFAAESADELFAVFENLPVNFAARTQQTEISALFAALSALFAVAAFGLSLVWNPLS